MSKQPETQTAQAILSRVETKLLQDFVFQIDAWTTAHGEKANAVEITYYPEDEGLEVANNEPSNGLKRNRATIFRTEILSWAVTQIKQLQGWNNDKVVTAFSCVYKDGKYGVSAQAVPKSELVADEEDSVTDDNEVPVEY